MEKGNFLLLLGVIVILSCQRNDHVDFSEYCEVSKEIDAPKGYEITHIDSIDIDGSLEGIQFINEATGYILGLRNFNGLAQLWKSQNSGRSWTNITLPEASSPASMFFESETLGYISYYGSHCPLLKTSDGGATWEKKDYKNITGTLHHIQMGQNGFLYALAFNIGAIALVRSEDEGESWQIKNKSDEIEFALTTFSFVILDERLYLSGRNGRLLVLDLDGNIIDQIALEARL